MCCRLGELREVLEVTDVLAAVVERHGVRGVLGLRSSLQQLCKSALDGMHARCLDKLAGAGVALHRRGRGGRRLYATTLLRLPSACAQCC